RGEQLRKLAQAGATLIVSHPVDPSHLLYFELDMIRRESGATMVPLLTGRWHPALEQIAARAAGQATGQASLGQLEQIVIERQAADRSREAVLAHFARDAELARGLTGELTKVSALASSA